MPNDDNSSYNEKTGQIMDCPHCHRLITNRQVREENVLVIGDVIFCNQHCAKMYAKAILLILREMRES